MFSSKTDDWATPQDFFDKLNEEFNFQLDVCADGSNAKCARYFFKRTRRSGSELDAAKWGGAVWCNPPYGREISKWVQKSSEESKLHNETVVMLIPARTDTKWFHEYIYNKAEVRFVKGRLKFGDSKNSAPFPSMVVVFKGN